MPRLKVSKHRQKHLTDDEWNAIQDLTHVTHLDEVFDVVQNRKGEDMFYDFEERRYASLRVGLGWILDALAYPLNEEVSEERAVILRNLFEEFSLIPNKDYYDWLIGGTT